jgi:hypothetical protein
MNQTRSSISFEGRARFESFTHKSSLSKLNTVFITYFKIGFWDGLSPNVGGGLFYFFEKKLPSEIQIFSKLEQMRPEILLPNSEEIHHF